MNLCPCCSQLEYSDCCAPYHNKTLKPSTPEALMRSRYAAYVLADVDYIEITMKGKALEDFDKRLIKHCGELIQWLGLEIIDVKNQSSEKGFVEFIAYYKENQALKSLHEISEFHRLENEWFYIDGKQLTDKSNQIKRNSKCPCGSQSKYKNCHGR